MSAEELRARLGHGQDAGEAVHAGAARACRHAGPAERSASTRSRSARATPIASWSATWFASGRSGSAARIVPRPAWRSSTTGWGRKKSSKIKLAVMDMWKPFRNVTKDNGAASGDPVRQVPHHAPSRRGARQGAQGRIRPPQRQGPALHQGPEVHAAVASREPHPGRQALARSCCWPPTSGSTPPTSSRSPSASSGTTSARAGRGASSTTGEPASNGSASNPTSASPT